MTNTTTKLAKASTPETRREALDALRFGDARGFLRISADWPNVGHVRIGVATTFARFSSGKIHEAEFDRQMDAHGLTMRRTFERGCA